MKKILLMCVSLLFSIAGFSENIQFVDQTAKNICVQKWDANGDGELSLEEAAAVTDIGSVFTAQKDLRSFSEFQYFTGVTAIPAYAFNGCAVKEITIPDGVEKLDEYAFYGNTTLTSVELPDSVTSIGKYAFANCEITSVKLSSNWEQIKI